MKIIGRLQAVAADRQVLEEYSPDSMAVQAEFLTSIRDRYQFITSPGTESGSTITSPSIFQHGKYKDDRASFGIGVLIMELNGDIVQTSSTDESERVLDDLREFLNSRFGFRLNSNAPRSFISNLVVEFDNAVERYVGKLERIGEVVSRMHGDSKSPFSLKRLAFGLPEVNQLDQVSVVEGSDFLVERRVNAPEGSNRYYTSAPLRTNDHISLLEEFERILLE